MKSSIARKVSRRITIIMTIAAVLLIVGTLAVAINAVYEKNKSRLNSILSIYTDTVVYFSQQDNEPIDIGHLEKPLMLAEYICKWYNVDYLYAYVPDFDNSTASFIFATADPDGIGKEIEKEYIGLTKQTDLCEDEKAVWNEEKLFGTKTFDNENGKEITSIMLLKDGFGNKMLVALDFPFYDLLSQVVSLFTVIALVVIVVILLVELLIYRTVKKKISEPAQKISRGMTEFISGDKKENIRLDESGYDEFAMISRSFNKMSENIDTYLKNISELSREQTQTQTEIDIAAKIQQGMLPEQEIISDFITINAGMTPAKIVGGDLYNYFLIDENRVFTAVADVSGKGISAAFFMAIVFVLMSQYADLGFGPAEILKKTNELICPNNPELLFTTAFVGIFDRRDKTYTYSNAGHNLPYIVNNTVTQLEGSKGTVLGLFEDETYTQTTVKLNRGDTVFLYTDGVTEATNAENEFFGTERLEKALSEYKTSKTGDAVRFIHEKISDFADGAEQHDDITMLALTVKDTDELLLKYELSEFSKLKDKILTLPVSRSEQLSLVLAAEERFVNIISYAFPNGAPENERIRITVSVSDRLEIQFCDGGLPYNPLENRINADDYDIETQIGGLGDFISENVVDDLRYERKNNKNIFTFIKYFEEEKQ